MHLMHHHFKIKHNHCHNCHQTPSSTLRWHFMVFRAPDNVHRFQLLSRVFYLFFSRAQLPQRFIALGLTQSCAFLFLFLYSRLMTEHVRPSGLAHLYLTLSFGSQSSEVCSTLAIGSRLPLCHGFRLAFHYVGVALRCGQL